MKVATLSIKPEVLYPYFKEPLTTMIAEFNQTKSFQLPAAVNPYSSSDLVAMKLLSRLPPFISFEVDADIGTFTLTNPYPGDSSFDLQLTVLNPNNFFEPVNKVFTVKF